MQTAQQFIQKWEQFETEQLVRDRNARLESNRVDAEFLRENSDKLKDDEETFVEEQFAALTEEQEPANDEIKHLMTTQYQLQFQAKMFLENEEFKKRFDSLKNFKVIKYHRFLQSLLYLLQFPSDQVVEPGTQKFFWKTAKNLLSEDFLKRMNEYKLIGPKNQQFKAYQTINFIERNITSIEEAEVNEYNMTFGRLFKWLKLAVQSRKADIIRRMAKIHKERDEREQKIKAKEERLAKRNSDLEEAKEKFNEEHKEEIDAYEAWKAKQAEGDDQYGEEDEDDEDDAKKNKDPPMLPIFDQKEFLLKWDEETPDIIISDELTDDVDNDWVLDED